MLSRGGAVDAILSLTSLLSSYIWGNYILILAGVGQSSPRQPEQGGSISKTAPYGPPASSSIPEHAALDFTLPAQGNQSDELWTLLLGDNEAQLKVALNHLHSTCSFPSEVWDERHPVYRNFANFCSVATPKRPQTSLDQTHSACSFPQEVWDERHPLLGNLTTFCSAGTQEIPQTSLGQTIKQFTSEPTPDTFAATFLLYVGSMTILHRRHKEVILKDVYTLSQLARWIASSLIGGLFTGGPLGSFLGIWPFNTATLLVREIWGPIPYMVVLCAPTFILLLCGVPYPTENGLPRMIKEYLNARRVDSD